MDLSYGLEYEAFRQDVRKFIETNRESAPRGGAMKSDRVQSWQKLLIEKGYTARTIPQEYGGHGGEPDIIKARIIGEEFARSQTPGGLGGQGISMLVPTLLELGTEKTVHSPHARRRNGLVPGVFRAQRGQRPREFTHVGNPRWRRMGRQWLQDLDFYRAPG